MTTKNVQPARHSADHPARLRVALVYDDTMDRYGGVAQHCLTLADHLVQHGHDVTLLVGDTQSDEIESIRVMSLSRNIRVHFNGNALSVPLFSSHRKITQALQPHFDVVHVQMPYSPLMAGRIIRRLDHQTAVVATFHVASEHRLARIGGRILAAWCRRTTQRIDRVITVSDAAEQFARQAYGIEETTRIPNMTPVGERSQHPPSNTSPIVAFVGRLEERKGVKRLIEEFSIVQRCIPDATLLIAGDGSQGPMLRRLVVDLGLHNSVHFLGAIDNQARGLLLASADVACFPSVFGESFGIVLIEAMAAGSGAVVGGDNAGHRAVLDDAAETIANARVLGAIASTLSTLLLDSELRGRVHERQQDIVRRYDSEVICTEILNTYRRALADRNPHLVLTPAARSERPVNPQ